MWVTSVWQRASRIPRSALSTQPSLGGPSGAFAIPCRKVVVEYCEKSVASKGTRDYLLQHALPLARKYPSVEFVVVPRPQRSPVLRGFYRTLLCLTTVNGRTKVISTHNLQATQIAPKMQLILDSSGAKTQHLKRTPVASTSESARGIWSPLHGEQ